MLRYTDTEKHTFLSRYWCKKLVDAGIDMKDHTYVIVTIDGTDYVTNKNDLDSISESVITEVTPTYTLADMIYKFDEYPWVKDGDKDKTWGPVGFLKDAPFYVWTYYPNHSDKYEPEEWPEYEGKKYIEAIADTPIEAAARMLIICKKAGIYIVPRCNDKYKETVMK